LAFATKGQTSFKVFHKGGNRESFKPRDFVAKKELDLILETEEKAEREIEEARQKAREILAEASKKADQIIADATKAAENKAYEIIEKAKRQADVILESSVKEARTQIGKMKPDTMDGFKDAVLFVAERVKKAV